MHSTFVITERDQDQKDNIEKLSEENKKLSGEIKKLSDLNNSISTRTEEMTSANSKIIEASYNLDQQSKALLEEVQILTKQSKKLVDTINSRGEYESEENAKTGELQFRNAPIFKENDDVNIVVGGFTFKNPFNIQVEDGKILFSLNVYDIDGNLVAEIDRNYWRPNKNFSGKFNYDESSFEVIDNKGRVAISIQYLGKSIIIQGMFTFIESGSIILAGSSTAYFPLHVAGKNDETNYKGNLLAYDQALRMAIESVNIKPIFRYTGKKWLHQRL